MAPNEYTNALEKALGDLENKVLQRDLLNGEIFGLKETVRVLASRVELSVEEQDRVARLIAMVDSATPKLTDSIHTMLVREYPKTMTAIEVRNALEDSSDSEGISLSACHAALKRMLGDGDVKLGAPKDGKATYRWAGRVIASTNAYASMRSIADLGAPLDTARERSKQAHDALYPKGRTVPDPPTGDSVLMRTLTAERMKKK
jgi:hypothetical protein